MVMRKLTEEEMAKALELATAMHEKDQDKYSLGYALLYLQERNKLLEDMRRKADYFVRFGMGQKELTDLRVALEKLHEMEVDDADDTSLFSSD